MKPEEHADTVAKAAKMNQDASAAMPEASVQQFIDNDIDDAGAAKGEQQQKEQAWKDYLAGPQMETASAFDLVSPLTDQPAQELAADTQHAEEPPAPPPLAQMLGDADTGDKWKPLEQPEERKKKRQRSEPQTDWGGFLGKLGKGIGTLGSATGSDHLSSIGGGLQGISQIMGAVKGLGSDSAGDDNNRDVHGDTITNLLGAAGSGSQDSSPSTQAADPSDDLQKALAKLTEAVEKLLEKLGGQAQSGVGGTQMPTGGSLGTGIGDGIDMKQIMQIIELIATMGRMLAMAA